MKNNVAQYATYILILAQISEIIVIITYSKNKR